MANSSTDLDACREVGVIAGGGDFYFLRFTLKPRRGALRKSWSSAKGTVEASGEMGNQPPCN